VNAKSKNEVNAIPIKPHLSSQKMSACAGAGDKVSSSASVGGAGGGGGTGSLAGGATEPVLPNAREALASLLQTLVASGDAHVCGGILPNPTACLPRISVGTSELTLPLNESTRAALIAVSSQSGVGKASSKVPVVDLSVRKSWELLPHEFRIINEQAWTKNVISPLLGSIAKQLEVDEWIVGAHLYKMLIYEEGSFFAKHRDNEWKGAPLPRLPP
jgi:hypothetical protein